MEKFRLGPNINSNELRMKINKKMEEKGFIQYEISDYDDFLEKIIISNNIQISTNRTFLRVPIIFTKKVIKKLTRFEIEYIINAQNSINKEIVMHMKELRNQILFQKKEIADLKKQLSKKNAK